MSERQTLISIVTPVYRASDCVEELYRRLVASLEAICDKFEIVMVDDASPDDSWSKIAALAARDPRVKAVKLSRNFGQHYAITAGLDDAQGDWVVVMDCDLQDQPEEIAKLYRKAQGGYDIVFARRCERKDTFFKKLNSRLFTVLYNYLGDIQVDNSVANFSISSRQAINYVRQFRERNRSFPIFLSSVGFQRAYVDVQHAPRFAGRSSYSFSKLLDLAVQCIVSQSNKPLRLSIRYGFAMAALSVLCGCWLILRYFIYSVGVPGWTSIMVLMTFLFGILFANIGILGLYLGKVFDEVKGRPLYVVAQRLNFTADGQSVEHPLQCVAADRRPPELEWRPSTTKAVAANAADRAGCGYPGNVSK
jgi:dolichol-phosphate mannosyltransferase